MDDSNSIDLQINSIIRDYLYNVSTLRKHDYFDLINNITNRTRFFENSGFGFNILSSDNSNENEYVVKEEFFLEGCTRTFLINCVMKLLLDTHHIQNDWLYGTTFYDFNITNREYELGNYLEFIAVLNDKRVGIRYTKNSYSFNELYVGERDYQYLYMGKPIPGFDRDRINHIDELFILDWHGLSEKELHEVNRNYVGKKLSTVMTIEQFTARYFSKINFEYLFNKLCIAIKMARKIISLRAIPQLLPNNMFNFKCSIIEKFSKEKVETFKYEFEDGSNLRITDPDDIAVLNNSFFDKNLREALIGNGDFAKSFITSEYLFGIINNGLCIDYTSVVVGYIKSVEQLLYLLYKSAFEGKSNMIYWDKCKNLQDFDVSLLDKYRFDPYNPDKGWKQEKYYHHVKTGNNAPEIGELTRFLRYYTKMCALSESGKEFVYKCLEDFRRYNRNAHFHKDNIEFCEYSRIERIRNNTHICLYYLLGGFILLDQSTPINEQLGIINYRFEQFYQEITQKRRRFFNAKFSDGDECVIYYLVDDVNVDFNADGILPNTELRFLKTGIKRENAYQSQIQNLSKDENFVKNHTISITRVNMPIELRSFLPQKNNDHRKPSN